MAYMIPEVPRKYEPKSKEGQMFFSLEKLPHDYYVVHSLKTTNVVKNALMIREADFVISRRMKWRFVEDNRPDEYK